MIRRTFDATLLNEIANHPEVRPHIGGAGVIDLTTIVGDPQNVAVMGEHGGWIYHGLQPGVYELHTLFLPEGRGRSFFAGAREVLRYMFVRTDALEILTKCPDTNAGARMAAGMMGFKERFRREDAWAPGVGISYQALTIDGWAMRDPEALRAGQAFHNSLEAAKAASGSTIAPHPDDAAHDRAVGTAWLMAQAGNVGKGVAWYNRWAVFAGYAQIHALALNVVDIGDAIVELKDGQTDVLLCR